MLLSVENIYPSLTCSYEVIWGTRRRCTEAKRTQAERQIILNKPITEKVSIRKLKISLKKEKKKTLLTKS